MDEQMAMPDTAEMELRVKRMVKRQQDQIRTRVKTIRKNARGGTKHNIGDTRPTVEARVAKRRPKAKSAKASRKRNR